MTDVKTDLRRVLGRRLREAFLGPGLDQTTLAPVALPGVDFDPANPAHVAPFTPDQVQSATGHVNLSLFERPPRRDGATSGVDTLPGGGEGMVVTRRRMIRMRLEIVTPSAAGEEQPERLEAAARAAFEGWRYESGDPVYGVVQRVADPPVTASDRDFGQWRVRTLYVDLELRHRVILAAA